jgi:PREDICTED: similar to CG3608-PA
MLLLFKTNDLLRGIETSLGTRGEKRSFLTMSKSCIRSVYDEKLKECTNVLSTWKTTAIKNWYLTKLSIYQFYLWFSDILWKKKYA